MKFTLWKQEEPEKKIKKLVRELRKTKIRVEMNFSDIREDLKNAYRQNKKPAPALLQGWNSTQNILMFLENQIAGFENQLLFLTLGTSLKEALEVNSLSKIVKAIKDINIEVIGMEYLMEQFNALQMDSMLSTRDLNRKISEDHSQMNDMMESINKEAELHLGGEFLNQMQKEDPEFFESVPDHLKSGLL